MFEKKKAKAVEHGGEPRESQFTSKQLKKEINRCKKQMEVAQQQQDGAFLLLSIFFDLSTSLIQENLAFLFPFNFFDICLLFHFSAMRDLPVVLKETLKVNF